MGASAAGNNNNINNRKSRFKIFRSSKKLLPVTLKALFFMLYFWIPTISAANVITAAGRSFGSSNSSNLTGSNGSNGCNDAGTRSGGAILQGSLLKNPNFTNSIEFSPINDSEVSIDNKQEDSSLTASKVARSSVNSEDDRISTATETPKINLNPSFFTRTKASTNSNLRRFSLKERERFSSHHDPSCLLGRGPCRSRSRMLHGNNNSNFKHEPNVPQADEDALANGMTSAAAVAGLLLGIVVEGWEYEITGWFLWISRLIWPPKPIPAIPIGGDESESVMPSPVLRSSDRPLFASSSSAHEDDQNNNNNNGSGLLLPLPVDVSSSSSLFELHLDDEDNVNIITDSPQAEEVESAISFVTATDNEPLTDPRLPSSVVSEIDPPPKIIWDSAVSRRTVVRSAAHKAVKKGYDLDNPLPRPRVKDFYEPPFPLSFEWNDVEEELMIEAKNTERDNLTAAVFPNQVPPPIHQSDQPIFGYFQPIQEQLCYPPSPSMMSMGGRRNIHEQQQQHSKSQHHKGHDPARSIGAVEQTNANQRLRLLTSFQESCCDVTTANKSKKYPAARQFTMERRGGRSSSRHGGGGYPPNSSASIRECSTVATTTATVPPTSSSDNNN